ncbi:MAG: hypothetical protein SVY15_08995 [Halobacteriota archaeon]|nr:hypothetical protein [Halobacteriota archaeon]MDY6959595.1 hypothetical protein [Halobacteriota archaeon]
MIREMLSSSVGVVLGMVFGLGLVAFASNIFNAALQLPARVGSVIGLIILLAVTAFLILKIRIVSNLIAGIIIGILINIILKLVGFDLIPRFFGLLGI